MMTELEARHTVTLTLVADSRGLAKGGGVQLLLRSRDTVVVSAELRWPTQTRLTMPLEHVGVGACSIEVVSSPCDGRTDEVSITARADNDDGDVIERHLSYSVDGQATTREFPLPDGPLVVEVSISALPSEQVGTALKMMAFNIWHGGRLDDQYRHGYEGRNIAQLVEFIRLEDPDVLFVVETYGAGSRIEDALNLAQPDDRRFHGVQLTRQPERPPGKDNLWLFTWLPVAETYPIVTSGVLTSFNFGGVRLVMPDGTDLHVFSVWLYYLDDPLAPTTQSALELALGLDRSITNDQIVATDEARRLPMARTLLTERLGTYVRDETAAVVLAGDFNTLSCLDWAERYAAAPGHEGLVLDWPAMRLFDTAGFTDTYRFANPDAGRYPGRTLRPGLGRHHAPGRVDYILTRGANVRVLSASTRTRRLPHHRGDALDALYPFYSDHAAVVSDLVVRGSGPGPAVGASRTYDPLEPEPRAAPAPPDGRQVPSAEMTATARNVRPDSSPQYAIDGDPRTLWQSDAESALPHTVTVDLGRTRVLAGVRYQPRLDGIGGIVTRYSLQVSTDGDVFETVSSGTWENDQLPKNVQLGKLPARHLRLVIHTAVGGVSSIAELTVFETEQKSHDVTAERGRGKPLPTTHAIASDGETP